MSQSEDKAQSTSDISPTSDTPSGSETPSTSDTPSSSDTPSTSRAVSTCEPELNKLKELRDKFIPPKPFDFSQLLPRAIPGAVRRGSVICEQNYCLKALNLDCTRGRREHLFYQLVRYLSTQNITEPIYYKDLPLIVDPEKTCDCRLNPETFRTFREFIPDFLHLKHLAPTEEDYIASPIKREEHLDKLYSGQLNCGCYTADKQARRLCSTDFVQSDYMCLEDIHGHCQNTCVLDLRMGRVTYDPLFIPERIHDQMKKYTRLHDFGFRVINLRNDTMNKGKDFGIALLSQEQVFEALDSFFRSLETDERKSAVIGQMLNKLERILEWFETNNSSQLRFYKSSLMFVYDSKRNDFTIEQLVKSVKVRMVDFSHVFHSHNPPPSGPARSGSGSSIFTSGPELNKDDNYLFGLRRLIKFFIMLDRQYRTRLNMAPGPSLFEKYGRQ